MGSFTALFPLITLGQGSASSGNSYVNALDRDWKMTVVAAGGSAEAGNTFSGTPFYNDEWEKGYIRLTDNRIAPDLSLKFNAYTSQIYLQKENQAMVLDKEVPVAEFGLNEEGRVRVFRRNFPPVGGNSIGTFYEVIADGKYSLLKLHAKRIVEKRDLNHVPVQEMTNAEFWYVSDGSKGQIVEVRHNKNALIEALPGQAEVIRTIIQEKKLKMKSDEDWVTLFNALNAKG